MQDWARCWTHAVHAFYLTHKLRYLCVNLPSPWPFSTFTQKSHGYFVRFLAQSATRIHLKTCFTCISAGEAADAPINLRVCPANRFTFPSENTALTSRLVESHQMIRTWRGLLHERRHPLVSYGSIIFFILFVVVYYLLLCKMLCKSTASQNPKPTQSNKNPQRRAGATQPWEAPHGGAWTLEDRNIVILK